MEPVRILLNPQRTKGLILNADLENFAQVLAKLLGVNIEVHRAWLVRSAVVYGFDCVLLGDRLYPVVNDEGFSIRNVRFVDLTRTITLDGGEVYEVQDERVFVG